MRVLLTVFSLLCYCICAMGEINPKDIFIRYEEESHSLELEVTTCISEMIEVEITYPGGTTEKKKTLLQCHNPKKIPVGYGNIPISKIVRWSPDNPALYTLHIKMKDGETTKTYGIRSFSNKDGRFWINDKPIYIRACGHEIEPFLETLNAEEIRKRLSMVKAYGFNTIRHHSHFPSDEYLSIADELGLLIQMEIDGKIGKNLKSERYKKSLNNWHEMISRGRHHCSTFAYGMGNEIYKNDSGLIKCQNALYEEAKKRDPIPLVLNRSGSNPYNDDYGKYDYIERPIGEYEHVAPFAKDALELYLRGDRKGRSNEFPIIAHEYPLVSSFPDVMLMSKYDEPPHWLATTLKNAREKGQEHLLPTYVKNSQEIQNICRKEMLEEARKYPELDGYSMLRFTDHIQTVSGVVNEFAEAKNVTSEEFLQTNGETVLLCDWENRTWRSGEQFQADLLISHHGSDLLHPPACKWELMNGSQVIHSGEYRNIHVEAVDTTLIGQVKTALPEYQKPVKLTLQSSIISEELQIRNEWTFWCFPEPRKINTNRKCAIWDPAGRMKDYENLLNIDYIDNAKWKVTNKYDFILTDRWQEGFGEYLAKGGKIWLQSDKIWPWPEEVGIFGLHITHFKKNLQAPVVFPEYDELCSKWMTVCSNSKSRYGNSATVITDHPALGNFPHEGFCDLQFWPMVYRAKTLQLNYFPKMTNPIIRAVDNYYRLEPKGYMLDIEVGKGQLFLCTLNITQSFNRCIESRYLAHEIFDYLCNRKQVSNLKLSAKIIEKILTDFKYEYAKRKPLTHNEMPARYQTRWAQLNSNKNLIHIPILQAKGLNEDQLDVNWEYAQTQWFYNTEENNRLTFDFSIHNKGSYNIEFSLASIHPDIKVEVSLNGKTLPKTLYPGKTHWKHFEQVLIDTVAMEPGKNQIELCIPNQGKKINGTILQVRDLKIVLSKTK